MQTIATSQNGRVRRSETEWRALFRRFSESGQSRTVFCKSEGIPSSTFEVWRRKLQLEKPSPSQSRQEFVELAPVQHQTGGWLIEIELPDGTMARLRS